MFAALERQGGTLACALEMPMSFCVSMEDLSFRFLEPSDEQIYAQIMAVGRIYKNELPIYNNAGN